MPQSVAGELPRVIFTGFDQMFDIKKGFSTWIETVPSRFTWLMLMSGALFFSIMLTYILNPYSGRPAPIVIPPFLPVLILIEVLIEEFIFRFVPLVWFRKIHGWNHRLVFVVLISSLLFWAYHRHFTAVSFVYLTIGGLVESLIFLKCGSYQKRYGLAFFSVVTYHYAFNLWGMYLKLK